MQWICRGRTLDTGGRPLIMGVLNVTPDSFSDGGRYVDAGRAADRALEMAAEGADIIDIGGESSRPGADPIDAAGELRRVLPVLERIAGRIGAAISVDTTKAAVAEAALAAGAHIVNDITALQGDDRMAEVVRESGAGVVLMHMQGTPRTMQADPAYDDVVREVSGFLRSRLEAGAVAGIAREAMVVDPGIGFGKTVEHNVTLIAGLPALRQAAGRPLVAGFSRKSFLGRLLAIDRPEDRDDAGLGALAYAATRGADIFRVHDVKRSCDIARLVGIFRAAEEHAWNG